jgi:disulfide bond formation protein DsbB
VSALLAKLWRLTPLESAALIVFAASAALAGAWIFEAFGYLPCELCLKQRQPYYVGVPLALIVTAITQRGTRGLVTAGFAALALVFAFSAGFGVYHAGVEWGFWQGPTACTGSSLPAAGGNLLEQLKDFKVVRCDEVAIRILGLSLAGWNALVSLSIAALAARAAYGSSTESQYK